MIIKSINNAIFKITEKVSEKEIDKILNMTQFVFDLYPETTESCLFVYLSDIEGFVLSEDIEDLAPSLYMNAIGAIGVCAPQNLEDSQELVEDRDLSYIYNLLLYVEELNQNGDQFSLTEEMYSHYYDMSVSLLKEFRELK